MDFEGRGAGRRKLMSKHEDIPEEERADIKAGREETIWLGLSTRGKKGRDER